VCHAGMVGPADRSVQRAWRDAPAPRHTASWSVKQAFCCYSASGRVVALTSLLGGEQPPGLQAMTRYLYCVDNDSPTSVCEVISSLSTAMMPGSGSTRSTRYSVTVPVAPLQLSVIDVSVTDVTVSVGAPGGSGRVAAAASFPNAEQPPGLHARTRYTY